MSWFMIEVILNPLFWHFILGILYFGIAIFDTKNPFSKSCNWRRKHDEQSHKFLIRRDFPQTET